MANNRFHWRPAAAALLLAASLPLTGCSRTAGDAPEGEEKMSARQGQTVYLDVAGYAYLERPIFDLMLNGINVDGPGGLVVGVPIKLGPQVVTWRDAGTGESFKAANVPELNTVNPQFRYLGFHIYPDNTVELLPGRYWPERTERGEAIIRAREQKHGK